jgi:ornithine cyclodeaminase/thiomorpholine-carboxylate dehydrogenase
MDLLILSQNEVQGLLDLDDLLNALAEGFMALSEGKILAPNRNELSVPDAGYLLVMPAWQADTNTTVKLVTVFHGNQQLGIPGHQALICVFDSATGTPLAVMDGAYITAVRTAASAALSARLLARQDARVLAIIGAGVQGRSHLKMLPRVRNFDEIRIASLHFTDAQKLAAADSRARACESYQDAVRGADVVCLCTTSGSPVISPDWLLPGTHVTSVGYSPPGGELPREVINHGSLVVETRHAFEPPPIGCGELAGLDPTIGTELGEILSGKHPGRQSDKEITVYKSMGHAMEDLVATTLVYQRARRQGVGRVVKL